MARAKKKVACQDCDRTFNRKGELQQHRREEHSRRNMCPICKRAFESEKRLKMHSQFHNVGGEYKCFYCSKEFNKAWKMKIHLVNHSGRPSYICEYCGDDFLYPGKILTHLKHVHDICYACKDCGQAVSVESQGTHKCKIYGCKDCLLSFTSYVELAAHVVTHRGRCASPVHLQVGESAPSSPPQVIGQQREGYCGVQGNCEPSQDVTPVSGDPEESKDSDPQENALVVAEETCGSIRSPGVVEPVNAAPHQVPSISCVGMCSNVCAQRDGLSRDAPETEESCDAKLKDLKVNERLSKGVLVSPSPPSTPVRCLVPNCRGGRRDDASNLTLLVQGQRAPDNTSVIRSEEEEDEEEEEKKEEEEKEKEVEVWEEEEDGEVQPPSYFSSILLRSPGSSMTSRFKVPDASTGLWKKLETASAKSLHRKKDELDKAVKKKDLLNTLHLYMDTDARLTQRSQTSLKSWLTGDSFSSSPEHDFVFGFEASVAVGSHREKAHYHYFNKIPKKEKVDMTFEDLCLF